MRQGFALFGVLVLLIGVTACQSNVPADVRVTASENREKCMVLRVYDGDTLACDLNGDGRIQKPQEHIRLLGIDTPETHHSAKARRRQRVNGTGEAHDEPMAQEASQWLRSRVEGKQVFLERDVVATDKYGRGLAFVYPASAPEAEDPEAEGVAASYNAQLLRQGYAAMLFMGKNRRYEQQFEQWEADAHDARLGIWQ